MKAITLVLLCLLAVSPAQAAVEDPPVVVEPTTKTGSVILPVGFSYNLPKELHNIGLDTNLIAVVYRVTESADGARYTLTQTSGLGTLDAYFFESSGGRIGDVCMPFPLNDGFTNDVETGQICPEENQTVGWAMVVLRWGLNAGFRLEW